MQPYQEEYIANIKEIDRLTMHKDVRDISFEEYYKRILEDRRILAEKVQLNMQLLRSNLLPALENIYKASKEEKQELYEFAQRLMTSSAEPDLGLPRQIHMALLNCARQENNRSEMIKELYWLGILYNSICSKLIVLDGSEVDKYNITMRLYFTEAAAYLKYYDEIDDSETRGYILRSRANMSLGRFKNHTEKIRMVKRSLLILQDKEYRKKAPDLPWDRYIFLAHRQMESCISRSKNANMTHEDIADIMESVYIIYEDNLKAAEEKNEKLPPRIEFSRYSIEQSCGIRSLEELLVKMEELMDNADISDFTVNGIYGNLSIPAFYCQYLSENPEYLPKRKGYLDEMYRKVLEYIDNFSDMEISKELFYALRQLSYTFLETENSISYKEFLQKLQLKLAPSVYVHSWTVGKAAAVFCEIIMDEEPNFFDDIDFIRQIDDPKAKKDAAIKYAMDCGIFHDAGKINFMNLYHNMGRHWLEDEYEMARLHTLSGMVSLKQRPSTLPYAQIALGHHSRYDGSENDDRYKRLDCQYRQMTDTIGVIDRLEVFADPSKIYTSRERDFDKAVEAIIEEEGRRFSPLLTARLRDKSICERLKKALEDGDREACKKVYERCAKLYKDFS